MIIVIGLDESYTETGIGVSIDGKPVKWTSERFKKCKCKTDKRNRIREKLDILIQHCLKKNPDEILVCVERIRTFTGGDHLRPKYLISTGALVATIVDTALKYGIKTYSADTRSWKSRVVGKANKGKTKAMRYKNNTDSDAKVDTIKFVKQQFGIDVQYTSPTGLIRYNDNISDAVCISLYPFCKGVKDNEKLLRREE